MFPSVACVRAPERALRAGAGYTIKLPSPRGDRLTAIGPLAAAPFAPSAPLPVTKIPPREPPEVLSSDWLSHTRLFHVESQTLRFSNGAERRMERLNPWRHRAVLVVPLFDERTLLVVREYGAGKAGYYLSFPKGALRDGEDALAGANRELMEEAGYVAAELAPMGRLMLSPSYMGNGLDIVAARQLTEKSLPGDEPEPLDVIRWPLAELDALIDHEEFCEAPAVAAALMASRRLSALRWLPPPPRACATPGGAPAPRAVAGESPR